MRHCRIINNGASEYDSREEADAQNYTDRPTLLNSNRIDSLRRSDAVFGVVPHIDRTRRVPSLRRINTSQLLRRSSCERRQHGHISTPQHTVRKGLIEEVHIPLAQ